MTTVNSTTPNFDPRQLQSFDVVIGSTTSAAADLLLKATKNGAGYAVVPYDMDIDHVELMYALSGDINTAGSGYFEIIAYENGVALWVANAVQIGYASAVNYYTQDRAALSLNHLTKGRELRVDIAEVPAGASTSYPLAGAVLRIVGVAK